MTVINALGSGKENAVSRFELIEKTGFSDRKVRKEIARLRKEGTNIINDQDGAGYYIATDTETLLRQYKQDTARAMAILSRRKALRDELKKRGVDVNTRRNND